MTPGSELPTRVLHPVLDTYLNAAVAITGCHSYGIAHECCEYDVVVVSNETGSRTSVRVGDSFMDLFFMSEKEVLGPSDPEIAVSLASVKPVRDNSLIFSTSSSTAKAMLPENLEKAAEARLARSLKSLGRADEALSKDAVMDADFWLLSGAYDFAYAWLYSSEATPAPSHLLDQLKTNSRRNSQSYEVFSAAVGLERASRKECAERLESLSIVYDAINASEAGEADEAGSTTTKTAFDIVKSKSDFLTNAIMHVDCYCFLGLEVCAALPRVSGVQSRSLGIETDQSQIVTTLCKGDRKMIGERVIQALGLSRPSGLVEKGIEALRTEVSVLAKKI